MKLRDQLLDALKSLPGTRHFRLHVLLSAPHKHVELYPYASSRPRIYAQHILILCSEQVAEHSTELGADSVPDPSRVFVSAIEATLFHIPATASAILYIAKVDSTGQAKRPAPTSALVRALISYYASSETRPPKLHGATLWVHLFARAERQYLFPNSADHPSKKPLNDIKLCLWWKRILGHIVQELGNGGEPAKLYYVLPGMNELEALQALGEIRQAGDAKGPIWTYGHPYSQTEIPLPYLPNGKTMDIHNLGQLIPSFDDDPKSRFIDEIACTAQVDGLRSPQRKRRRTDSENKEVNEKTEKGKEKEGRVQGELGAVSADEFWERMSFRQECVAGAITGFFVLVFPSRNIARDSVSSSSKNGQSSSNPLAPQPGEVSHHLVQRVIKSLMTGHEFSTTERSLRATSILEKAICGLCSGTHVPETQAQSSKALPPFLTEGSNEEKNTDKHENREDISPNPFPEPEPSADMYSSFVFGEIAVSNPDPPPPPPAAVTASQNGGGAPAGGVTVLAVRKKKRS